jgi:pimeloyl-ACP methyl ester carboxylesterase
VSKLVAALATAAAAVAGLVLAPAAAAAPAPTADPPPTATPAATAAIGDIAWGDCTDPVLKQANAQCGMLTVPLDYADPGAGTIQLALSRVAHTVAPDQYQGVMLVNPGGPGGSGLELSTLGQYVPDGVGADYDWIGFDPRGVGASVPALTCDPNYFGPNRPAYVPITPTLQRSWLTRSQQYAQSCAKNNLPLLRNLTTVDSAKDMDSIRAALGVDQINYYGFSYGTYLGQVYATLFPQRVRRMVLDSNVDPRDVWYQANLNQDVAFNRNIKIWFGWVAKYDNVYHLGNTEEAVQQLYYQQLDQLAGKPAGGKIGPDEWNDVVEQAAYYRFGWTDIAGAIAAWVHHADASGLISLYQQSDGPGDDNEFAVYLGVQCTDTQWPTNWMRWQRDNWRTYARAPFMTWNNAWFNAPCAYWPVRPSTPVTVDGGQVAGALLIDETLDAATPYAGSLEVRRLFPNSRLIAEPGGTTHADSLFGDLCVDNQVAAYLGAGTLPPRKAGDIADTTCAPLPAPVPATGSGGSATAAGGRGAAVPQSAPAGPAPLRVLAARLNALPHR